MKINNIISILCFLLIFSCNKKTENKNELDILRTSTNIKTYPVGKMDSIQAIKSITQQKVQELLDLSALYINGNQNTQIDSAMLKQMQGYFYKPDSLTFKTIFDDLKTNNESLKIDIKSLFKDFAYNVKTYKVSILEKSKDPIFLYEVFSTTHKQNSLMFIELIDFLLKENLPGLNKLELFYYKMKFQWLKFLFC